MSRNGQEQAPHTVVARARHVGANLMRGSFETTLRTCFDAVAPGDRSARQCLEVSNSFYRLTSYSHAEVARPQLGRRPGMVGPARTRADAEATVMRMVIAFAQRRMYAAKAARRT